MPTTPPKQMLSQPGEKHVLSPEAHVPLKKKKSTKDIPSGATAPEGQMQITGFMPPNKTSRLIYRLDSKTQYAPKAREAPRLRQLTAEEAKKILDIVNNHMRWKDAENAQQRILRMLTDQGRHVVIKKRNEMLGVRQNDPVPNAPFGYKALMFSGSTTVAVTNTNRVIYGISWHIYGDDGSTHSEVDVEGQMRDNDQIEFVVQTYEPCNTCADGKMMKKLIPGGVVYCASKKFLNKHNDPDYKVWKETVKAACAAALAKKPAPPPAAAAGPASKAISKPAPGSVAAGKKAASRSPTPEAYRLTPGTKKAMEELGYISNHKSSPDEYPMSPEQAKAFREAADRQDRNILRSRSQSSGPRSPSPSTARAMRRNQNEIAERTGGPQRSPSRARSTSSQRNMDEMTRKFEKLSSSSSSDEEPPRGRPSRRADDPMAASRSPSLTGAHAGGVFPFRTKTPSPPTKPKTPSPPAHQ